MREGYVALLTTACQSSGPSAPVGGNMPCLVVIGLLLIAHASAAGQAQAPSEYEVKAIFLYRFSQFIEWPGPVSREPICIGIVGQDPFGGMLEQVVQGKLVNGREFVIKHFKPGPLARDCHMVFISSSERKRLRLILGSFQGAAVLTVGDTPGFCQSGGVINFELVNDSVRFEINIDATERAGLRMSSKLLSLAKVVRDAGP